MATRTLSPPSLYRAQGRMIGQTAGRSILNLLLTIVVFPLALFCVATGGWALLSTLLWLGGDGYGLHMATRSAMLCMLSFAGIVGAFWVARTLKASIGEPGVTRDVSFFDR